MLDLVLRDERSLAKKLESKMHRIADSPQVTKSHLQTLNSLNVDITCFAGGTTTVDPLAIATARRAGAA